MTPPDVLDVARDAITVLLLVSGPVMLVGLSVCLLIALFQALTQLQEMTLTFVPKILAVFTSLLLLRPFMMTSLISFMERIAQRIVAGAPG
jgi:flagellar biosynthetic protein FliQ